MSHVTSPSLDCITPSRRKRDCQRRGFPWSLAAWCTFFSCETKSWFSYYNRRNLPHATNSLESTFRLWDTKEGLVVLRLQRNRRNFTCSNKLCTERKGCKRYKSLPPCIYWPCLPKKARILCSDSLQSRLYSSLREFGP